MLKLFVNSCIVMVLLSTQYIKKCVHIKPIFSSIGLHCADGTVSLVTKMTVPHVLASACLNQPICEFPSCIYTLAVELEQYHNALSTLSCFH